jgi:hypothetical protein
MLVHGQQGKPGIVGFRNRSTRSMVIVIAQLKNLQVTPERFTIAPFADFDGFPAHIVSSGVELQRDLMRQFRSIMNYLWQEMGKNVVTSMHRVTHSLTYFPLTKTDW